MNFDTAFHKLLGHEGGYVNHPQDPGGETNWGITAAVARENGYQGSMRDLPISTAKAIARKKYWDAVRADELPAELRYPMFDAAFHSHPEQSIRWLQRALGVADDGKLGPITLAAAAQAPNLAGKLLGQRLEFMTNLSTWQTFGKGWARRIAALLQG